MARTEQVGEPIALIDELVDLERLEPLDAYAPAMTRATAALLEAGTDALDVTRTVADVNDVLTTRLLALAEARLGPPPRSYSWLALGSHGRGEQVLSSDQDNALVYGGARLTDGDPDVYFAELAELVVAGLERAGMPRCTGGYMATAWRHPAETYAQYFQHWVDDPLPANLLKTELFLDVRPVHGDLDVGRFGDVLLEGGRHDTFLLQMARATVTFKPPVMLFGHVHTEHGYLDVKRSGTAAIVLLARLYALAAGSSARTTLSRLKGAAEAGLLSVDGADQLGEAYRLLTGLRLRHQVEQALAGDPVDNRIRVDALSHAERRGLRDAVRALRVVLEITANRYRTHTVT